MANDIEACYIAVGARVRMIRENLGWTQQEIAEKAEMSRASLANIEAARQRIPLHDIEAIAKALGTNTKFIMKGIWW